MESIEQNSSTTKRKYSPDESQISFNDLEEESSKKFFSSQSMTTNPYPSQQRASLGNYQQTTKIIQEFNIQQLTTSDITVSSTINIKSTPKQQMKLSNNDLLSEADFQRVVQDITPADRDLFDEFLNGIKQRTDDYLFLSSFDDLPLSNQEQDSTPKRHSSLSLPSQTSTGISNDRRRNSIPRGSSTIHYSPHSLPITNRPSNAAAQTLKQMAVQHQQRTMHNQQQPITTSYTNYPYSGPTRPYYHQSQMSSDNDSHANTTSYYQSMSYSSAPQGAMVGYNHNSPQHSNLYGIQNYSYQSSSSFYPPSSLHPQQQHLTTSTYSVANYSPANSLLSTDTSLPSSNFFSSEDNLPILDL